MPSHLRPHEPDRIPDACRLQPNSADLAPPEGRVIGGAVAVRDPEIPLQLDGIACGVRDQGPQPDRGGERNVGRGDFAKGATDFGRAVQQPRSGAARSRCPRWRLRELCSMDGVPAVEFPPASRTRPAREPRRTPSSTRKRQIGQPPGPRLRAAGRPRLPGNTAPDQRQPSCPTPTTMLAAVSSRRSGVARP